MLGHESERAVLIDLDSGSTMELPCAPVSYTLHDAASWADQGNAKVPWLLWERGEPATLEMDLMLDTTDSGKDCEAEHAQPLRGFLEPRVEDGDSRARPPQLEFRWGSFRFQGVLEDVRVRYELFRADGTPVRALATIRLKEASSVGVA